MRTARSLESLDVLVRRTAGFRHDNFDLCEWHGGRGPELLRSRPQNASRKSRVSVPVLDIAPKNREAQELIFRLQKGRDAFGLLTRPGKY